MSVYRSTYNSYIHTYMQHIYNILIPCSPPYSQYLLRQVRRQWAKGVPPVIQARGEGQVAGSLTLFQFSVHIQHYNTNYYPPSPPPDPLPRPKVSQGGGRRKHEAYRHTATGR